MSTRREIEAVIAIQLGINHTSNAYLIKYDQSKNCKDFNVPYDTQSNTTKSVTTPTVALFDDKGGILSYGFEAELQHMQLDNANNHLLFREFIWDLFCSDETVPENLPAVNGRQMKSIDVVTAVLGHMIKHIKTKSELQGLPLTLKYVLTIPTCACKESRTFMREAAVKAGCSSENIKIVEEAAAVLQFCLHNKQDEGIILLDDDNCNRKFLVVECEQDNATLSILYFINKNMIKIVFEDNTEIWEGFHVLHNFVEMISLEARKTLLDFFEKYPLEYYDFLQEVKSKIRRISPDCPNLKIKISSVMLEELRCAEDINQIILVGEIAQSQILQNIIKTAFSAKNVIIPWDGSMAAVRGAVFYGQGHVSFVTDVVPNMQQTPLNNAQVALPKALSKERRLIKSMIDDGKPSPSESKESSQQKLCVIL